MPSGQARTAGAAVPSAGAPGVDGNRGHWGHRAATGGATRQEPGERRVELAVQSEGVMGGRRLGAPSAACWTSQDAHNYKHASLGQRCRLVSSCRQECGQDDGSLTDQLETSRTGVE